MTDQGGLRQRKPEGEAAVEKKVEEKKECVKLEDIAFPTSFIDPYMPQDALQYQKIIHASINKAQGKLPEKIVPYLVKSEPFIALFAYALSKIAPLYFLAAEKIEQFMQVCPPDLFNAVLGVIVCFFGGVFPTLIAAAEAWNVAGGAKASENLKICYSQLKMVKAANEKDDNEDLDGDGVLDVNQLSAEELLKRKTYLFATTVQPRVLQDAVAGVYTGWIGVIAVLKLEFAKTIALGVAIGSMLERPAKVFLKPILKKMLDEKLHDWIDVGIESVCKSIAISIAWTIQRIISAFHSALRGGLMFARGIMRYANKMKYIAFSNDDESYLDEIVGYGTAFLGFMFQVKMRFTLPWIMTIVLWPFSLAEWYIVWTISE